MGVPGLSLGGPPKMGMPGLNLGGVTGESKKPAFSLGLDLSKA